MFPFHLRNLRENVTLPFYLRCQVENRPGKQGPVPAQAFLPLGDGGSGFSAVALCGHGQNVCFYTRWAGHSNVGILADKTKFSDSPKLSVRTLCCLSGHGF